MQQSTNELPTDFDRYFASAWVDYTRSVRKKEVQLVIVSFIVPSKELELVNFLLAGPDYHPPGNQEELKIASGDTIYFITEDEKFMLRKLS